MYGVMPDIASLCDGRRADNSAALLGGSSRTGGRGNAFVKNALSHPTEPTLVNANMVNAGSRIFGRRIFANLFAIQVEFHDSKIPLNIFASRVLTRRSEFVKHL
jgi:hypothetical protein